MNAHSRDGAQVFFFFHQAKLQERTSTAGITICAKTGRICKGGFVVMHGVKMVPNERFCVFSTSRRFGEFLVMLQ